MITKKNITTIEPIKAAAIIPNDVTGTEKHTDRYKRIATNIFAPEEIPSTNGPAIGFLK